MSAEIVGEITSNAVHALRKTGTYNVSSFSTNKSGTGAVFTVTVGGSGDASIAITTKGSGYYRNEIITILDSQLGNGGGESLSFKINNFI